MTNKEFRDILAQYPDDYTIQLDNSFGWEPLSNKYKEDPHLYINTDCGFIEIEPSKCRELWTRELPKENCECVIALKVGKTFWQTIAYYDKELKEFSERSDYLDEEIAYKPEELICWFVIPEINKEDIH